MDSPVRKILTHPGEVQTKLAKKAGMMEDSALARTANGKEKKERKEKDKETKERKRQGSKGKGCKGLTPARGTKQSNRANGRGQWSSTSWGGQWDSEACEARPLEVGAPTAEEELEPCCIHVAVRAYGVQAHSLPAGELLLSAPKENDALHACLSVSKLHV